MSEQEYLMADYDSAWKLIEYNMKTNWQILVGIASLIGALNFLSTIIENKLRFVEYWSVYLVILGGLWCLFFELFTSLAHVYSIRRLEIEAICGMRTNWRGYLSNRELEKDAREKISDRKQRNIYLSSVKKAIEDKNHVTDILLDLVKWKYAEGQRKLEKWYFRLFPPRRISRLAFGFGVVWGIIFLILMHIGWFAN